MVEYNKTERKRYLSYQFKEHMKSLGCSVSELIKNPLRCPPFVKPTYKISYGDFYWEIFWPLACTECNGFDLFGWYASDTEHHIGSNTFDAGHHHIWLHVDHFHFDDIIKMFDDFMDCIKRISKNG